MKERHSGRKAREQARSVERILALAVFGLLVTLGPLAFGAVDTFTQIIIAAVFAVGVMACPPQTGRLSKWANRLVIFGAVVLVAKELAPAAWFGASDWRATLTESYGVVFPWTHHPEPGRAVDAWFAGAVAVVWFLWVRTLASERDDRPILAWTLFFAVAVVAVVSFATYAKNPTAIYGLRLTSGWTGFGPFPNRNHTACLLAMGVVMGAGCIAWAATKRNYGFLALGVLALAVIFVALLETHSRGGLIGLGAGLAVFLGLSLLKTRNHKTFAAIVAVLLMIAAGSLMFGRETLARFSPSSATGGLSSSLRLAVWHDALAMWSDARWLGHGVGSFASVFPMYQSMDLDMQSVIHPESSWLQWLAELGLIPVLLGALGFVVIAARAVHESFSSHSGFFLRVAGIAAAVALLIHGLIDVPAHRWGTAGFALAALAIACPRPAGRAPEARTRKAALVPLAAAAFWVLPIFFDAPLWSPLEADRIVDREMRTGRVPFATLEQQLQYFPLNPGLHEAMGLRLVDDPREAAGWQRHFRIATRLVPASWALPREQAMACARYAPSLAMHYWQLMVEKGGHRAEDLFNEAIHQTAQMPNAAALWEGYVEAHPELALVYASRFQNEDGRPFFDLWWRERALTDVALRPREAAIFYQLAERWSSPGEFQKWMAHRSDLRSSDFRAWATLLHGWGEDEAAWRLLSEAVAEPAIPTAPPGLARSELETRWERDKSDAVNARGLVQTLAAAGEDDAARQIILTVAKRDDAPKWFIRKAAYALAAKGQISEGVATMLREHAEQ